MLEREGFRAALILIFILNVLFFPFIWGSKTMLDSAQGNASILPAGAWAGSRIDMKYVKTVDSAAAAWFFEPSLALTGYEYAHEKTIPLWNPYQGYGTPFAADMQSQPFYPLTILLSIHLTPRTYNLYLLVRLFVLGFFAYLFLRLFLSFVPALAGGIAAMLAGYYILYITMPHLSVEVLIPAALFAAEKLLNERSYGSVLGFTVVLFLAITGGMPESSLLLFALLYLYIGFRILSDPQLRRICVSLAARVSLASLAGLCLSSVLLLPFLEFMRHGYDAHQPHNISGAIPGLYHYAPDTTVLRYFFPLIFGPYGFENEVGLVAFFLILIAGLTVFRRLQSGADRHLDRLTGFFFVYCVFLILKRYGILVNNVGLLPLFRYVDLYKYDEALVSVCVAVLCAIGVERLARGEASRTVLAIALAVSFAMVPIGIRVSQNAILQKMKANQLPLRFPESALVIAASALFCVAICLILFGRNSKALSICLTTILAAELSLNYIPALYYFGNTLPDQSEDPYRGAPYIDMLKARSSHFERIFARNAVLFPDWPSAFQLQDARDLDGMYYWKYLPFVRNFLPMEWPPKTQELLNRFTGWEREYGFQSPTEKRLLQLSSVRYLISVKPYLDASFRPVYDREVKIYQYDKVLPRAALYYRAEVVSNENDALKRLTDPNLNIFQTVVLNARNLNASQLDELARINQSTVRDVEPASIASYRSDAVEVRASLKQDAVLVLNDSGYPGWVATVDGVPTKWISANYLFRGILLTPGKHVIKFLYRPRAFYVGVSLAGVTSICLAIPGILRVRTRVRNRMRSPAQSTAEVRGSV
jgi:hypothetical protein